MRIYQELCISMLGLILFCSGCGMSTGNEGITNTPNGPVTMDGNGTNIPAPANSPLDGKWSLYLPISYCTNSSTPNMNTYSYVFPFQTGYYAFAGSRGEFNDFLTGMYWERIQFMITYGPNNTVTLSGFTQPDCSKDGVNYSTTTCIGVLSTPSTPITYQYVLRGQTFSNEKPLVQANLQLISVNPLAETVNAGITSPTTASNPLTQLPAASTDFIACGGAGFNVPMFSDLYLN